jgi:tetratricopeptide (TPR) repeat protein
MADEPDLDAFLKRVDEISGLVDGVAQDKPGASDAADRYLSAHENDGLRLTADRTHISKATSDAGDEPAAILSSTFINAEAGDGESSGAPKNQKAPPASGGMEQSASLAALQADAEERASRRAANRAQAGDSKEAGNACFRAADYVGAEAKYTEALRLWPDGLPLYTNRAQARLRLHDYAGALSDCDWALRLHDRHPKALLRRGLALAGLGRFDDALDSLERARKTLPASGRGEVERHMAATRAARDESARDRAAVMALAALGEKSADGPTADKADSGQELSPADCAAAKAVLSHLPTLLQAVTARARLEDDAESDCSRSDGSSSVASSVASADGSGNTSSDDGATSAGQAKEEATPLAERAMCVSREAAALVRAFRGLRSEAFGPTSAATTSVAYDVFRVQRGLTLLPSLAHFLRILGDKDATEAGPGRDGTSDVDVDGALGKLLEGAAEAAAVCTVLELLRVAAGPNGHAALWEQAGAAAAATHLLKSPHQPVKEATLALLLDSLEAHADTRQVRC